MSAKPTPTKRAPRKEQPKRNGTPDQPGRPHDLDRPVDFGGKTLPAAEAIVAIMRSGEPLYLAADACGIAKQTAYEWRRVGARVASELLETRVTETDLTDYEAACLRFSDSAMRAEAEAEAMMAARLGAVAAGGHVKRRVVVEYDRNGDEVKRTEYEETMPPDGKALGFWLERRGAPRWGRVQRIEHAIGAEGPVVQTSSPLEQLADKLRAIERRKTAGAKLAAVETTAEEQSA